MSTRLTPRGPKSAPRLNRPPPHPHPFAPHFGPLISNIFSLHICFSLLNEYFKCGPVYFTCRFRFGSPKLPASDFNLMRFNLMNLRNSSWDPLNCYFLLCSIIFSGLILIHPIFSSTPISHPSLL